MADWEDGICPPYPWPWPGPRPPWANDAVIDQGLEVFAALSLINSASRLADAKQGLQIAKMGAQMLVKQAEQLNGTLQKAR